MSESYEASEIQKSKHSHDLTAFPPLPFELVCDIIEIAARESMSTALALSSVSKVAHHCITPVIYRTVVFKLYEPEDEVERFHHAMKIAVASSDKLAHVRSLSLPRVTRRIIVDILSGCTQLERLVLGRYINWPTDEEFCPKPWEVVLLSSGSPWTAPTNLLFQNVTHFHYSEHLFFSDEPMVEVCKALPRLTHFGFPYVARYNSYHTNALVPATKRLLSLNPSLDMVIVHALLSSGNPVSIGEFVGRSWVELAEIPDTRLLAMPGLQEDEFAALFESGETIWDNAVERFGDWRAAVRQ